MNKPHRHNDEDSINLEADSLDELGRKPAGDSTIIPPSAEIEEIRERPPNPHADTDQREILNNPFLDD